MRRIVSMLFALMVTIVCCDRLCAQSMWQHRDPSRVLMFRDVKARHVGDVLTIIVSENTDVDLKDERTLDKASNASGTFNFNGSTAGGQSASANLDSATTSNRNFDGSSEFTVEREFSDRITVTVLDVLPNGNMLIGGKRRQVISGESRVLVVSGIVRPFDVRPDNTVQSRFIANLEVAYHGKGPESSFTNQGWLGRLTNKIWPF